MPTISEHLKHAREYLKAGDFGAAESLCLQVLQVVPDLVQALSLLGDAYLKQQRLSDAIEIYRRLIAKQPHNIDAHNNLGVAYAQQAAFDNAIEQFDAALQLKPDYISAGVNRGRALQECGRLDDAVVQLGEVLRRDPSVAGAHLELGHIFTQLGQLERVVHHYEQALRLQPECAEAHWNLAMAKLALGDFQEGWREYQWRWKCAQFAQFAPNFCAPAWDGSPLQGRTILVLAEQGLGDTLQFIRYASVVSSLGAKVIFRCPRSLENILRGCHGIDEIVCDEAPLPKFDCYASLLSLPFLLKTTLISIPAEIPYLRPDKMLIDEWGPRIKQINGFKVGIVWQGGSRYPLDRQRSIPLAEFERLARLPCVQLISLQRGAGNEQLPELAQRFSVIDLGDELDQTSGAFMDTAAVMMHLNLVIACDTSIVHLAGALNVPTWVAVPTATDWRWLRDRDDSPWYPTIRVFRQSEPGNWGAVFARMAVELEHRIAIARHSGCFQQMRAT